MSERIYNVLFLSTRNAARSILAEAMLNKEGRGRFRAFSAGIQPKSEPHPLALQVLLESDYPTEKLRSKSRDAFLGPDAPVMDFIFTLCDEAGGEVRPDWPGQPVTAEWTIEDPASVEGSTIDQKTALVTTQRYLKNRIGAFIALPISELDAVALSSRVEAIGQPSNGG
ncbi:arsenate reductase ArsC [Methylobacterium fujisawaense]